MNKIGISHIGLSAKEQLLMRNLCRLSSTVMGQFTLVQDANSPQGDVLLVNTQAQSVERTFQTLYQFKQFRSIIALQDNEHTANSWLPQAEILTRPMVLRRVTKVFERLVNQNRLESESTSLSQTILVVDDSLPVRTFMKQRLHDLLGNQVAVDLACDGVEALQLIGHHSYDLVFLDVLMPNIDGYQVCREIKSRQRTLPVVMLTSKGSTLNKVKAKMSGSNGYITKPPTDLALLHELGRFLPNSLTPIHQSPQLV
ncbi:response regulator [Reinekea sp.]|jgi:CheY-like chemotaxis protein|uniref:response regulator transcription factor n=1 Tax=Reinekea sp. TaxID=1970455 RepID=UPI002A80E4DF|nr:response regulator [Reinekea sp.]